MAARRYSPRPLTEGERWTAEALGELRRRRFRAGAWVAFVNGSLERSRLSRSLRPALARQAATWGVAGDAAWLAASVAPRRRSSLDPPVRGGITDWLDGTIARRCGRTRLGRDLDTTADLAFLTTAAVSAHRNGRLPGLAFGALATRHAIGLAVALGAVFGRAPRSAPGRGVRCCASAGSRCAPPTCNGAGRRSWSPVASSRHARRRYPCRRRDAAVMTVPAAVTPP